MSRIKSKGIAVGALVCGLSGAGLAFGEASPSDVQTQMETLKAQVDQLRSSNQEMQSQIAQMHTAQGETWLNERRAEEVKALVREVLSDADTRASLLEGGMTAGHNGSNFFLASEDGTFLLKLAGQLQARYIANFRNTTGTGAVDANEDGFQIRRAKLAFEGFIGNPKLEYKIQLAPNRDTGAVEIEDAWIAYTLMDGLKIWGGRFQDRFSREAFMSSKTQQTVERSAVANIFAANDDYVEGAGVEWKALPDMLMFAATVNDGLNSGSPGGASTGFQNSGNDFQNDATDVALSGRADLKLAGDWKQMGDVEAWSSAEGLQAFLGAGVHYEVGETGDKQASSAFKVTPPGGAATTVDYDSFFQWTVDGLVKIGGLGVMGSFYGWHIEDSRIHGGANLGTLDNYAATIQAGYMVIPDKLEPFGRFEWISVDDAAQTNDLKLVTAGVNYFFKKHAAKFTIDAVYALDNINSANTLGTSLTGAGLLTDDTDKSDQVTVRAQFQLLF